MKIRDRIKELRRVPAKQLRPSPKNWRTHPKAQQEALRGILAEVGYADAVLARELGDGTLELIDGHLRAETTPDAEIPVLILDVTEEEAAKILVTLDPLAAMAGADAGKLAALLDEAKFSSEAIDSMLRKLGGLHGVAADLAAQEDEAPAPLAVAVSRPGDLWLLDSSPTAAGGHRLLCGDSTQPETFERLMAGSRAALVATDPPYLVDYTGERPQDSGKDWSATFREVEIKDPEGFFRAVFTNVVSIMAPHAAIYCWHAHRRCGLIQRVWQDLGILDHQEIVWVKPASVFGRVFWHFRHEPCMMGWVQGSMPDHDAGAEAHLYDSVWDIRWEPKGGSTESSSRPVDNEHPTQKPVEIFARPMRRHTRAGDICLEPFSGSGSQLVAAEQLGRRCFAVELEPVFVDVAIRRWQALTGKPAMLDGTKRTWEQIARDRKVNLDGPAAAGGKNAPAGKPKRTEARAPRGKKT